MLAKCLGLIEYLIEFLEFLVVYLSNVNVIANWLETVKLLN